MTETKRKALIESLNHAQQVCDESANWITGDDSYSPEVVGNSLAEAAVECRQAIVALQEDRQNEDANPPNGIPQVLLQVSSGVLDAIISTRPVAVFIYDWDNIKAGGHEAVESDVNGFRHPVTEDSDLFHKEALDCFKQAKEIHERSL